MSSIGYAPGQAWTYRVVEPWQASRIVIGALVSFESGDIVCCAVTRAPARRPDGEAEETTIPFLPLSAAAFAATVVDPAGEADLPEGFASGLAEWQADPRGLTVFTVPFDGSLDRLIARQMASIVGVSA